MLPPIVLQRLLPDSVGLLGMNMLYSFFSLLGKNVTSNFAEYGCKRQILEHAVHIYIPVLGMSAFYDKGLKNRSIFTKQRIESSCRI